MQMPGKGLSFLLYRMKAENVPVLTLGTTIPVSQWARLPLWERKKNGPHLQRTGERLDGWLCKELLA